MLRWTGARVGKNVRICSSVTILGQQKLEIGDDVWIGPQTMIGVSADVRIGSHVDIAPRVYIGTGTHELDPEGPHTAGKGISRPVMIGDGVWIGACAVILPGARVGEKAMIAAGAVVVDDVPGKTVMGGVPARKIRDL